MTNNNDEPVLPHVKPVPGGLFSDQAYEATLSEVSTTIGQIAAALPAASTKRAAHLRDRQRELIRCQRALMPADTDAIAAAYDLCGQVRAELASTGE